MLLSEAIRKFNTIKKGAYTRFSYRSEVPVKAEFKDSVKITKYCKATGRFGIYYGNLASVKNKEEQDSSSKPIKKNLNKEWILKNIIEYNKNTDKFYLNVYSSPNRNNYIYLITEKTDGNTSTRIEKNLDSVKDYVQNSYLNKKSSPFTGFYKVNLDNVINLG